ncbi:MAG: hypothetical protein V3T58_07855 [Candidatus Hydrothermarchaeales archaeon]
MVQVTFIVPFKPSEVMELFDEIFGMTHGIARALGELKKPVDVAIDITDQLYYGNKSDSMVGGGGPSLRGVLAMPLGLLP